MLSYIVSGILLLVYLIAVWLLTGLTKLAGADLWILRIALAIIGIAVTVVVVLLIRRRRARKAAGPAPSDAALAGEIQFLIKEANNRLAASTHLRGGGKRIAELPAFLFIGDPGSTKTSVIVNSGIQAELLAGQDRAANNAVPPTRSANLWVGNGSVFVEAGSPLIADPGSLRALVQQIKARSFGNVLGKRSQSPRAVVVCFDCEQLLRPDASAFLASAAKRLNSTLGEVAQTWGNRLPVYVLFTKLDRIHYFMDYVRNLALDEAAQVFGMTLPLATALNPGVYNQEQSQRLSASFDALFTALAAKRIDYLRRENDPAKPPNVYEFPREFRKLRDNAARFLLDLGRPSQLRASPFLRGFFFTGIRPVTVDEPASGLQAFEGRSANPETTQMFRTDMPRQVPSPSLSRGGRRVPQWVFLGQFFAEALMGDQAAIAASGTNAGASMSRRILFGAAAGLCLLYMGLETVSYLKNRSLLTDAKEASLFLKPIPPSSGQLASIETLQKLDNLREPAAAVSKYEREGAPWSYRWGLYPGRPEYENVRALYCDQLRRQVLSDTQMSMLRLLRSVPGSPGPDDNYDIPYSTLKAHLISTTKYHEKGKDESEILFMTNTLTERWAAGRPTAPDQYGKTRDQFRFYSEERETDFCPVTPDPDAIDHARSYLCQFRLVDRAYRNMIDEISRKRPPLRFNDPAGTVVDPHEVLFAFSREGYAMMQAAIQKAPDYINREQWVLGDRCMNATMDPALLKAQLQARYESDFISQWMTFLNKGRVTPYASFKDAAAKLTVLSNPAAPPLLKLFCMISENTAVDNAAIKSQFQSFQSMSPPATCHSAPNGPPTQDYMVGLGNLRLGVDRIANSNNPASENLSESGMAKSAAVATEQKNLLIPKAGSLLEDPIVYAENLIRNLGPDEINKKGGGPGFCGDPQVKAMFGKYPFSKGSPQDVRPEELSYFFAPNTGKMWQFYNETLQEFIAPSGGGYGEKPGAKFRTTDQFLFFFNKAAKLSHTLYMTNPAAAHASFALQGQPSQEFESYTMQIGGQSLRGRESGSPRVDFTWPDTSAGASLQYKPRDEKESSTDNYTGPWALVRLFDLADLTPSNGGQGRIEYVLELQSSSRFGKQQTGSQTKRTATLKFSYDGKGAPGTILPGDLRFQCIGTVVRK